MKLIITVEGGCVGGVFALSDPTDFNPEIATLACALVDYDNADTGDCLAVEFPVRVDNDTPLSAWLKDLGFNPKTRRALRGVLDADNERGGGS